MYFISSDIVKYIEIKVRYGLLFNSEDIFIGMLINR